MGTPGIYLPKTMFVPSSTYHSPYNSYKPQYGGARMPPIVDWGLLFNLAVFTIFICSFFYICLYRYRNKSRIMKENEIKQKKLLYEFQAALKENQKQATVNRYNMILENKRAFQNPYLLNQDNSPTTNQSSLAPTTYKKHFENDKGYDLLRQSYEIDSYRPNQNIQTPFNNEVNLMNW